MVDAGGSDRVVRECIDLDGVSGGVTVLPVIDAALVKELIAEQFPCWAHLPVTGILPGGWDNRSFRLGEDMLVRVPSRAIYAARVPVEQHWLPYLATHLPFEIPTPLGMGAPGRCFPLPWSVYRWIEGKTLSCAETDLVAFAAALGAALSRLHRVDPAGGPLPGKDNLWRGGPLSHYDEEVVHSLAALRGTMDCNTPHAIWRRALAGASCHAKVWVHGDVAPGNLLLRDGRLLAIIDWGQFCVGDPACDLAICWTSFDPEARAAFRNALAVDAETWARGAGWALWKALIVLAGLPGTDANRRPDATRTLKALLEG